MVCVGNPKSFRVPLLHLRQRVLTRGATHDDNSKIAIHDDGTGCGAHAVADAEAAAQAVGGLDTSSTEFLVNLGGGVERAIRENIRFRGDMRYFFGGDLVPDYWRLSAGLQFGLRPR